MAVPEVATAVPPAFLVLAAALVAAVADRRVGHAAGLAATALVVPWVLLVPEGSYLDVTFLGFEDVVLFTVDPASRLMGFVFGLIGAAGVLYAWFTGARRRTTALALSYVGTSLGAVFAGDWLSLVFFWELMALTSTLLVWEDGGDAVRAGFRYALLHGIGGSFLMAAVLWHYVEVGTFALTAEGIAPGVPAALAAIGIGVNVGYVGLHAWLPDTYPRPHVAASVFLCVYTTKTGVYALYRAFPEGELAIAYMGTAMAVWGVTFALLQDDMRRLLSYHIQSQVGYMVAGVGLPLGLATAGGLAHVFNHILYKGLLFMVVGVVIYRTGRERLSELGGLWRVMPITAITFAVAALSISGFPGFNGFVSKGMVTAAAHEEHYDAIYYLLLAGGVGTFLSFMKLGYYAFLQGGASHDVLDANRGQQVAMVTVAGLCVLYGLYPDPLFAMLPGEAASEAHPFTVAHLAEGFALAAIALGVFLVIKVPLKKVPAVPDVDALYNPIALYGTRGVVVATTETYAAVDRAVVRVARTATWLAANPHTAVERALVRAGRRSPDADEPPALRAGIGTSVAVVVALSTLVLFVLIL